jgi:hypothetical protein
VHARILRDVRAADARRHVTATRLSRSRSRA